MSKVTIMVGLSGSGKSSVATALSGKDNSIILSSDDLRQELYGDINDQDHNEEIFRDNIYVKVLENKKGLIERIINYFVSLFD